MIKRIQIIGVSIALFLLVTSLTGMTQEQDSLLSTRDGVVLSQNNSLNTDSHPMELSLVQGHNEHNNSGEIFLHHGKKSKTYPLAKDVPSRGNTGMFPLGIGIYTTYEGIEKQTSILESIIEGIDVDNNPATGVNGKDIKIGFYIIPYPDLIEGDWVLFLSSYLRVLRLGEEIKYGDFQVYLEISFTLPDRHVIRIGYSSPKNEEIPRELNEIVTIAPYLFYNEQPEFYIDMAPTFDQGVHNLSILAEYLHQGIQKVTIDYTPAVETTIHLMPHKQLDRIDFSIQRISTDEQTITLNYEGLTSLGLILEDIPQVMAFTLSFKENTFEYSASDAFNATLILAVLEMELYMKIDYLPQYLATQFLNEGGYLFISIDNAKTRFILANAQYNPTKSFTITNLTGESRINWLLSQKQGYVTIEGFQGLKMEISLKGNSYNLDVTSILQTTEFKIRWDLSIPGFVFLDTNNEWLNYYSFNLTFDTLFGILIEANLLKAEDFQAEWQTTIPFFTLEGTLTFIGQLTFSILLNGTWYPLF